MSSGTPNENGPADAGSESSAPLTDTTLPRAPIFATTRWTLVLRAGDSESPQHAEALNQLCGMYWYPLYAFARRQGASPPDAQDLTQGFFATLLERNYLDQADPRRGRFRSFLLGAFKHFLSHRRDYERAAKRGGGRVHVSLDEAAAEGRYSLEPRTDLSPDKLYERAWAKTVLSRVKDGLRARFERAGKRDRFEELQSCLPGDYEQRPYSEIAARLGISEGALRVELHRLRAAYRALLRSEIAQTVTTVAEIDEELRHLIEAMQD
jgi:RNA polymerase sigma-70 factor (ECF subfamily)